MHLKTLTLRGFKSFASATTLEFEPGVTCVVGPNGSGKSNVVDALAWVMGEQGAKTLRGGKMEDVIFAGTAGRPPLGRAEVSLTIDNSDNALPIDYTEVTISRTLFRNGGSEYAINGSPCRLLDIQDLLSDSGLGREMHVIVGQGQLDAVLRATPEDRRGFIEEAAGVLKHRKRKEKALRKLDAMQGNLQRLSDLTAEVRRQLGPLGRQAQVARRAATIQSDLRDAKSRLLADDLAQLTASVEQEKADERELTAKQTQLERELAAARDLLTEVEARAAREAPLVTETADTWYQLSSLRDRLQGVRSLAAERMRLLATAEPDSRGQDPEELEAQAERVREMEQELETEAAAAREVLDGIDEERQEAEEEAARAASRIAMLLRAVADQREGLARLSGQVVAQEQRVADGQSQVDRLTQAVQDATDRAQAARREQAELEAGAGHDGTDTAGLDADLEVAAAALDRETARLAACQEEEKEAERDRAHWAARVEALELSLDRKDGAGALLAGDDVKITGSVAALVAIEPGYEDAISAALGPLSDAVAVADIDSAISALRYLRVQNAGRAGLVVGSGPAGEVSDPGSPPQGTRWALDAVTIAADAVPATRAALRHVVIAQDLAQARAVLDTFPELTVVTLSGDLVAAERAWGGSSSAPSLLHLQSALEEARERHEAAVAACQRATRELDEARGAAASARETHEDLTRRRRDAERARTAAASELGRSAATVHAALAEVERVSTDLDRAKDALELDRIKLDEISERFDAADAPPEESDQAVADAGRERDEAEERARRARAAETEARLTLRTIEERVRAIAGRAQSLESSAAAERHAREQAAVRERRRREQLDQARQVHRDAQCAVEAIAVSLERATEERQAAQASQAEVSVLVTQQRARVDELGSKLAAVTDQAHHDEVARAQNQLRVEQAEQRARDELGMEPDVLIEEFGPHRLVPVAGGADDDIREVPYDRATQEKRLRAAERDLAKLGRVNPLALEEFSALEERHKFLSDQLADLTKSRADLLSLIKEIDERVETVFAEAYEDTAEQFIQVFARMFPGGEGRLVLTDPQNLLTTGVDVEARPAGKKVKRLSLLSGGERSLTAVAFLVAIFKARPSPFYVMDEVEAALDDVNLGRLLEIFRELQKDSQLIVVTHQKRTMEIADALYGVTMQGDGITTVISQRLRERADESAEPASV